MEYQGTVQGGVVVFEPGAALPEGTRVRITADPAPAAGHTDNGQTLGGRMMKYAGAIKGLPADLARNHDHYAHGAPRK